MSVPEGEELGQVKGKGAMGREWGRRCEREKGKDFTRKMKKRKLGERRRWGWGREGDAPGYYRRESTRRENREEVLPGRVYEMENEVMMEEIGKRG